MCKPRIPSSGAYGHKKSPTLFVEHLTAALLTWRFDDTSESFSGTKVRRSFGMNKEKGRNFRFCLEICCQPIINCSPTLLLLYDFLNQSDLTIHLFHVYHLHFICQGVGIFPHACCHLAPIRMRKGDVIPKVCMHRKFHIRVIDIDISI